MSDVTRGVGLKNGVHFVESAKARLSHADVSWNPPGLVGVVIPLAAPESWDMERGKFCLEGKVFAA